MALLDVGCGPGTITADLAGRLGEGTVMGIDLAEEVVEVAREQHPTSSGADLSFQVGDVYALEFADETFDMVYAHQVLQHLGRPVDALAEMRRVLKPGRSRGGARRRLWRLRVVSGRSGARSLDGHLSPAHEAKWRPG